jgi:hypothetical protein
MSFDPLAFLALAERLAESSHDESHLRTAVGRAYYALYLLARTKLGKKPGSGEKDNTMKALKKRDPSAESQLATLERLRVHADYLLEPVAPYDGTWDDNWSVTEKLVEEIRPKLEQL